MIRGLIAGLLIAPTALAYESDQFTHRLQPVADAMSVLDERVNEAINEVARGWRWGHDPERFAHQIYKRVGGLHWVDRIERFAMESERVDRIEIERAESIYADQPWQAARVARLFGVSPTIRVNDVLFGTDKLGHFFSQGLKFWRRYRDTGSEVPGAQHSAYTERAIFGQLTTGSYSNADLVANYEGHRFYRSLFEDGIVANKPAIVAWSNDEWEVQRSFTFADHVNDYWDEALNINHYSSGLKPSMAVRFRRHCADYQRRPARWQVREEAALVKRYAVLELRSTADLRLDRLCSLNTPSGQP